MPGEGSNGQNGDGGVATVVVEHDGETTRTTVEGMAELRLQQRFPFPPPGIIFPEKCGFSLVGADELEDVLARLISDCPEFGDLDETRFRVLYKKGTPDWYGKTKVKGEEDVYISNVDVVILISLQRCYASALTYRQVEALLHQQLCHLRVDEETEKLGTRSPDVVGFEHNVRRYGAWLPAFVRFGEQMRLFETEAQPQAPAPAADAT